MFITNQQESDSLLQELKNKIPYTRELKILVGYFYYSGLDEIIQAIVENPEIRLKILIGLDADLFRGEIMEYAIEEAGVTPLVIKERYKNSLKKIFTHGAFDFKAFHDQVNLFLSLLKEGRIELKKTKKPNHAKVYIFRMTDAYAKLQEGFFITGSSNLSRSGLSEQNEFNVSIKDFGFDKANEYFDRLWDEAVPFHHKDIEDILNILKNETLIREISPFEAYLYILKVFLDTQKKKAISGRLQEMMEKAGFRPFRYQLDAIGQALQILEVHDGVIIADVVGLGKSVIASSIAFELRKRGVVIVPPGLIGDDEKNTGWKKYLEDFGLASMGWEAHSLGKLESVLELTKRAADIEVVIVDEAHRFRNEDTQSYALLKEICRNKKVILLTATPFNNKPSDIFALLKLFVTPRQSTITFEKNLEATFSHYGYVYDEMLFIKKNYRSDNPDKIKEVEKKFKKYFNTDKVDLNKVDAKLKEISSDIKSVLTPVMIRRNRKDLLKHPDYKKDVQHLSVVTDPGKGFYELNKAQSEFYDRVVDQYFVLKGDFRGAIYLPYKYELGGQEATNSHVRPDTDDFNSLFQDNLFDLMRRLMVKRFESSFGAFLKTVENFIHIHRKVKAFIEKTGVYVLDRDWINKILEYDEDEFEAAFTEKMKALDDEKKQSKGKILYRKEKLKPEFFHDLDSDIGLLEKVKGELEGLKLHEADPKATAVCDKLAGLQSREPERKIIVFTEYRDTVAHLEYFIRKHHKELFSKTLFVSGHISQKTYQTLLENFDASLPLRRQKDDYQILICTDKLSEGFNLNRAGIIINYDIPWNPVRVIQRLGRINRIGRKVFDELHIMNFFPTFKGESIINQEKIAQSKMFMIHNSIGEDAKIFSPDEEPTPSELFTRLNTNPENLEQESIYTRVYVEFEKLRMAHPDVALKLGHMPFRVKVSKSGNENEIITVVKKHNLYFLYHSYAPGSAPMVMNFEQIHDKIRCEPHEPGLPKSTLFWYYYDTCLRHHPEMQTPVSQNSLYSKAYNNLNSLKQTLRNMNDKQEALEFLELLLKDLKDYGTLPDFRLRQITDMKNEADVLNLKEELGPNYLKSFTHSTEHQDNQIIISVENQKHQPS